MVGFAFASGGYQPDAVVLVAGALTVMTVSAPSPPAAAT
jgi:hypothetical protein